MGFYMSTKKFVKNFYREKENLLQSYLNSNESTVTQKIQSLNLSTEQLNVIESVIDDVLTDTFYTILLGLSGCSTLGGSQEEYKIFDEGNNEINADEIEEYAWSYLQDKKPIGSDSIE